MSVCLYLCVCVRRNKHVHLHVCTYMYVNVCLSHWGPILAPHLGAAHSGGWSVSHAEDSQSGHTETPPTPSPTVTEGSLGAEPRSLWARPSRSPGSVKVTAWTGGRPSRGVFRPPTLRCPTSRTVTPPRPGPPLSHRKPVLHPREGSGKGLSFHVPEERQRLGGKGRPVCVRRSPKLWGRQPDPPSLSADHQRHFQIAPKHTIVLFLLSGKTAQGVS